MNYYAEWWDYARKSMGVLTKQTYLKQLEQELTKLKAQLAIPASQQVATLQKEKTGWLKLNAQSLTELNHLKQQLFQTKQEQQNLQAELDNNSEQIKALQGKILDIKDLSAKEIKRLEKDKEEIIRNFANGSAIGTTHWIYWKNLTDQANQNLTKQKAFTEEWKEAHVAQERELKERAKLIATLEEQQQEVKQELDFTNSKIKQLNPLFSQVLGVIKKNVILRDKSKLKEAIANIQELMEWEKSPLVTETNTPAGEREE